MSRWVAIGLTCAGLALSLTACQRQEFEPIQSNAVSVHTTNVHVRARQLPPNIMLVVDRSGSMIQSVSGTGPACSVDGTMSTGYDPRSPNACKWNDLKTVLADPTSGLLVQSEGTARFGLLAFPGTSGDTCSPGNILVPVSDSTQPVRFQLMNQLAPGGGTPSAQAILTAAQDPALSVAQPNRQRFLMLITDGLPNCSSTADAVARCNACNTNASSCRSPGGCKPTFSGGNYCALDPFAGADCLDEDGLASAIAQVHAAGIDTFVIGIGADTAGPDPQRVLNRAAVAGGQPRDNAITQYYQANTVDQLRAFLAEIIQAFPCRFVLDPIPTDPKLMSLTLHDLQENKDTFLQEGTDWQFTSDKHDAVDILGDTCTTLQNAPDRRYELQISYASKL